MNYDVVVVGGGTAGCAAAYTLGKAGKKVLIVSPTLFENFKIVKYFKRYLEGYKILTFSTLDFPLPFFTTSSMAEVRRNAVLSLITLCFFGFFSRSTFPS